MSITRRMALKSGLAAFTAASYNRIFGANERVRTGHIGISTKSIGMANLQNLAGLSRVEVAALCDIYAPHLAAAAKVAPEARLYWDFRHIIADPSIDAVVISTPDHWHPLMTLLAFEAGKHVYCEKPIGHYPYEVLVMMAARKAFQAHCGGPLVFQDGQWQHSDGKFIAVRNLVRSGAIGQVKLVRSWFLQQWTGLGPPQYEAPYAELGGTYNGETHSPEDGWNMWCGPAPYHRFTRQLCHFNWRHVLPYGSGMAGDWGIHLGMGVGLWVMEGVPKTEFKVTTHEASMGCIPASDLATTPFHWRIEYNFGPYAINFVFDGCSKVAQAEGEKKRDSGILFEGTDGHAFVNRDRASVRDIYGLNGYAERDVAPQSAARNHWQNWIDAIRDEDPAECVTNIESVGPQNLACLLGVAQANMPTAPTIEVDPSTLRILTPEAIPYLMRPYRAPWNVEWDRILKKVRSAQKHNAALKLER